MRRLSDPCAFADAQLQKRIETTGPLDPETERLLPVVRSIFEGSYIKAPVTPLSARVGFFQWLKDATGKIDVDDLELITRVFDDSLRTFEKSFVRNTSIFDDFEFMIKGPR